MITHFMKDKVHNRLGVSRPLTFPVQTDFLHLLGSEGMDRRPKKRAKRS